MTQLSTNLLDKTEELFHQVRYSVVEAAAALYEVHKTDIWRERAESWSEYVQTLGISQGYGSKLIGAYEHFVVNGGVSHANIAQVEWEKLYLAKNLKGTPEEQIQKILALKTRGKLKEQLVFEKTGQEHEHNFRCTVCGAKPIL